MPSIFKVFFFLSTFVLIACSVNEDNIQRKPEKRVYSPELQSIISLADLQGSVLIYDWSNNSYHSNDFDWASVGQLPASTFKLPNTIIGLETGVIESQDTVFKWDGTPKRFKTWQQDLVLKDAFHYSCVPCYQHVARQIGTKQMSAYLEKLSFGDMDVNDDSLDTFWLKGQSRVSQFEQVMFLVKFFNKTLPISERTDEIVKEMMVIETNEVYQLSGKTGWSVVGDANNAWFIGYILKNGQSYFFATNIKPTDSFDMKKFANIRKQITLDALKALDIL